jgi:hypothetical protein
MRLMSFSGGYQSKVLKFVVQQSRRLSDRLQQQARQTKVTTVWGLQVLLYPLYRLLQTTHSQPLRQAVAKGWSQLHRLKGRVAEDGRETVDQPAADTPIRRVLEAIQCHWLAAVTNQSSGLMIAPELSESNDQAIVAIEIKPLRGLSLFAKAKQGWLKIWQRVGSGHLSTSVTTSGALAPPAQIQGIATLLPNRHLVLVTTQNQVLDILTPQQQHQLQQWLIWEFAEYCRRLRTAYRLAGQALSLPQWRTDEGRQALSPSAQKPALPAQKIRKLTQATQLPKIALPVWNSLWQKVKSGMSELGELISLPILPPALPPQPSAPEPPLQRSPGLVAALFQSVKPAAITPTGATLIQEVAEAKPELTTRRSFAVAGAAGIEIEAEAFVIGYEKHFLEQILEGLDRLMVGLEAIAAYVWQKLSKIEPIRRWQQWLSRFFT